MPLDTQLTHLLGGRVSLIQPKSGYRIGMDGALLACASASLVKDLNPSKSALELGCGVGGALMALKALCPDINVTGIEREPDYAAMARRNATGNASDATIIEGDIGHGFKSFGLNRFDLIFSNPPYFDDHTAMRAPHPDKVAAYFAEDGLKAWLDFALMAVKDGGDIVFIHRADRLADILGGLAPKAGSFIIRPIYAFADKPAKRVLVRAQRLGKAPLKLLPALILHDQGERKHTPMVESILRGETALDWA